MLTAPGLVIYHQLRQVKLRETFSHRKYENGDIKGPSR